MGLTATLAGRRVLRARASIPAWGCWYADASVDGEVSLTGSVDLVLADLTLRGTVISGGPGKGRSEFRIVAGAGGWGRVLKKASYANDAGVKASTVLGDAAALAGETLDVTTIPAAAQIVGPAFVRRAEPACDLLEYVSPQAWYVGEDGVTRLGRRPATTLAIAATRLAPVDRARGTVTLASDSIATLLPGIVVDDLEAVDVQHELAPKGGIRSTIWGAQSAGGTSRRLAAFRALIEKLDPDRRFRGVSEYRVVTIEGKRLNLQPVQVSTGMPELRRVSVRGGAAGYQADVALGARVLVGFINADRTRPFVLAFEDPDSSGFAPTAVNISADAIALAGGNVTDVTGGLGRVVRYGDPIVFASPGQGTISAGAIVTNFSKVKA